MNLQIWYSIRGRFQTNVNIESKNIQSNKDTLLVKSSRLIQNSTEWADLSRKLKLLEIERNKPDGPDWKRIQTIAKDLELLAEFVLKKDRVS